MIYRWDTNKMVKYVLNNNEVVFKGTIHYPNSNQDWTKHLYQQDRTNQAILMS